MTLHNIGRCIDSVRGHLKNVRFVLAAVLVSVFSVLPLATASAAPVQDATQKQVPSAPRDSDNGVSAPVPGKAQAQSSNSLAPAAWNVGLSANSTNLWPKQYSTLTATTNQDVGPTPYYISIYDVTTGTKVKVCGSGTTCFVSLTQQTATTRSYRAYISAGYPTTNPPANVVATSATVTVKWQSISVSLKANLPTTYIGGTSTLTATTSTDVWPTPFYTQIYDATTGVRLKSCASGTSCAVTTSKAFATTHRFVAYVSDNSAAYPPTGIQATSNSSFITWANSGYRVSLASASVGGLQRKLTATSNVNVGPTPYYIEIFNARTGGRLAICGNGTTCTATVSALTRGDYVAFVSSSRTSLPPLNTQASSNVISMGFSIIFPVSDTGEVAGQ